MRKNRTNNLMGKTRSGNSRPSRGSLSKTGAPRKINQNAVQQPSYYKQILGQYAANKWKVVGKTSLRLMDRNYIPNLSDLKSDHKFDKSLSPSSPNIISWSWLI
jgi:hypothetical protein